MHLIENTAVMNNLLLRVVEPIGSLNNLEITDGLKTMISEIQFVKVE
uniref:Uncharacterized protein n=1 Tax=Ciona intestinalis TaxID=7719 RepID=H2XTG4_CIOIN